MSFKFEVGIVVVNCVFGNDHSKQLTQQKPTKQQFKFGYILIQRANGRARKKTQNVTR